MGRDALIAEAAAEYPREPLDRLIGVRGVVAFVFARQQHVQRVVRVVVPLRGEWLSSRFAVLRSFSSTRCTCRPCCTCARTWSAKRRSQSSLSIACTASRRKPSKRYSLSQ